MVWFWADLDSPFCASDLLETQMLRFTLWVGYTAKLDLYTSDRPGSGEQLSGHVQCAFQCDFLVLLLRVGWKGTRGLPLLPERCP